MASLTYKDSGVDIEAGNRFVDRIRPLVTRTHGPSVLGGFGGFAGLFAMDQGYRDPVLVSGTDGVGTKLLVALAAGRHDSVGIDLVAMCVNDILTVGARPLFFLDYMAVGKLDQKVATSVVEGIVRGCEEAGCALLGGETAELPGLYQAQDYDLAGFAVGIAERDALIAGDMCRSGDQIVGVPSSGLHSNGYSLARRALDIERADLEQPVAALDGQSLADALLEPTRIYAKAIADIRAVAPVRALCHVTGGGLTENPPRVIPAGLAVRLEPQAWRRPAIFDMIQREGGVSESEMRRTFNLGLGLLAVVPASHADQAVSAAGEGAAIVGELVTSTERDVQWA